MSALNDGTGLRFYPAYLDRERQAAMVAVIDGIFAEAPLYTATMPKSGQPLSVRMSNCGSLGWVSDIDGYRYQPLHPQTGRPGRRCRRRCSRSGTRSPTMPIRRRPA